MDLAARRTNLAALLAGIDGLQVYDTVPAKVNTPCAVVTPGTIRPHPVMGPGVFDIGFNVQVLVQLQDWESMQNALDGFISTGTPNSVLDALETGSDLIEVTSIDSYGTASFDDGQTLYGSVVFHLNMIADD